MYVVAKQLTFTVQNFIKKPFKNEDDIELHGTARLHYSHEESSFMRVMLLM